MLRLCQNAGKLTSLRVFVTKTKTGEVSTVTNRTSSAGSAVEGKNFGLTLPEKVELPGTVMA
jgi:hypothetical protein